VIVVVGHQVEGDQFLFFSSAVDGFLDGFVWSGGHHSDHVGAAGIIEHPTLNGITREHGVLARYCDDL
jgi:hypothetical protein